jgi:hypothetical protein
MVNAERLLEDLKRLKKKLEADIRRHHAASTGRTKIEDEWREARCRATPPTAPSG